MGEIIERIVSGKKVIIEITDTNVYVKWNTDLKECDYVSINPDKDFRDIAVNTNQMVSFDEIRKGISGREVKDLLELETAIKQKKEAEEVIAKFQREL